MGGNIVQRPEAEALGLLGHVMDIFAGKRSKAVHARKGDGRTLATAGMSSRHSEV